MRRLLVLPLALIGIAAIAQDLPPAKGLSLERLYAFPQVGGRSPANPQMSPDGSQIAFGWNRTGMRGLDLWVMSYPAGQPRMIVEAKRIPEPPRQDDDRTEQERKEAAQYDDGIGGAQWSPDGKELMFGYRGRVWLVSPDGKNLRPMIDANDGIFGPSYSPCGKAILYRRGANLFRFDRASGAIRQLTFLSRAQTSVVSYSASPDGKNVVIVWADTSKTGSAQMMDFVSRDRARVVPVGRDWNGDEPFNYRIGLVPMDGGVVRFLPDLPKYMWVNQIDWAPNSAMFAFSWIKDDYRTSTISVVTVDRFKRADVYTDTTPSNFVSWWRPLFWSRDSKRLYFGTDVLDGKWANRSLMSVSAAGLDPRREYAENHDILNAMRPKESDRIFLVTMARSSLKTELTILESDGKRTVHVPVEAGFATERGFDDAALPMVSDDGKLVATYASDRVTPREIYAVEPNRGRLTRSQLPEFNQIEWANHEEVSFPSPDGRTIRAVLITRKDLDKTKKHPAFISSLYANSGKLSWNGYFENYAAVELGFVVLQVDFRASYGQGGEFNTGYFQKMGIIDSDEAVAAKRWLDSLGYVRSDRVGVWGWSYGGFLTCMIQLTRPGVFDTGVAVASVTDWRQYNEGYTRARLGPIRGNEEVYKATSPVHHAAGLKGNLLLVHGMLDDNVLFQDTAQLMQRLIEAGKSFDQFNYPRDDHSIGRDESRPHVRVTIMRYLWQKLFRP